MLRAVDYGFLFLSVYLGLLPKFITSPSVIVKNDGFSFIVGCKYVMEEQSTDLAEFAYLIVNETVKRKLSGRSKQLNESTFQLPDHKFIIPGRYKCLIEATHLYKESIYSDLSAYVPMPGMIIEVNCNLNPIFLCWLYFV